MKIRHPVLIRVLGFLVAQVIRLWMGTLRFRHRAEGENPSPYRRDLKGRWLYCLWHETLLAPTYWYSHCSLSVLISQHGDGDLIAAACAPLGIGVVRGSTTRNGAPALRQLVQAARFHHLVMTPDGPRGPRRQVQAGVVYLAARTGLPIVPVGFGFARAWRVRSWDRFALPRPFSAVWAVTGAPIVVPPDVDRTELEAYRRRVQQAMDEATAAAQRLAGEATDDVATGPVDATRAA
jgi:lysophospholipid acyltransferase (LPLAT)-like uncharacterized protein